MPEKSRGHDEEPPSLFGGPAVDQAFCGIGAGLVSVLFMHPLDLLKVKFQVAPSRIRIVESLKEIVRDDGWRGLYRGLSPNMVGNAASWGFYFLWYTQLKAYIATEPDGTVRRLSAGEHLSAAALAGVASAVVTNPLWVVKTRMFTSRKGEQAGYRNVLDGLWRIGKEEGLPGLYRGTVLALVGVSNGAIQFMAYEELKKWRRDVARRKMGKQGEVVGEDDTLNLGNTEYILTSGAAKLLAIGLTYPYQVVRSRIQNQKALIPPPPPSTPSSPSSSSGPPRRLTSVTTHYRSIPHCIASTYKTEGLSAFYKGLAPNAVRVLPGTCVTFVVYENLSRLVREGATARDEKNRARVGVEE